MASLSRIVIQNYRNIPLVDLEFSPNVNCITGNNGEGKTNLLDAIYYLSMTKSAFCSADKFNIRYGSDSFSILGRYKTKFSNDLDVSVLVNNNGDKIFKKDNKSYDKISSHIGLLPIVIVSPMDISLISDAPEERRKFINSVLVQTDSLYLSEVQQYKHILNQRNKLLKAKDIDMAVLDIFDTKLSLLSKPIYNKRKDFISKLSGHLYKYYALLSEQKEEISITYQSDLNRIDLYDALKQNIDRDRNLGYTSVGLHRDDLLFKMNEHLIRRCGSQGQQKSFLVALKFAQYDIMKEVYNFTPILLLDDIFDKLDLNRISSLLSLVSKEDFGQIFITESNKVRLNKIVDSLTSERAYFETKSGSFRKIDKLSDL